MLMPVLMLVLMLALVFALTLIRLFAKARGPKKPCSGNN